MDVIWGPEGEHFRPKLLADIGGGMLPEGKRMEVGEQRHQLLVSRIREDAEVRRGDFEFDAVTVAHIAAALEWQNGPTKDWIDKEAKAMERLTAAWEKYGGAYENPKAEEELNIALDDLAVAHSAAAFEGWSGKLKW